MGLQRRTAYSVVKSAIGGLTLGLALEYGRRGIIVNIVSPGYTLTEPLRRKMAAGTRIMPFLQNAVRWAAGLTLLKSLGLLNF